MWDRPQPIPGFAGDIRRAARQSGLGVAGGGQVREVYILVYMYT